jgi:hypothetical protein
MSLFGGILDVDDTDRKLTALALEDRDFTSAINRVLAKYQAERNAAQQLFLQGETTMPQEAVRLGGFDEGQEIGPDGRPLETHVGGTTNVAYPLKRVAWAIGWNIETFARMTIADLDREVMAKTAGNAKRHMREIFRALLGSANYAYSDDIYGELTVRRLANGDGTLYPPVAYADEEAEDNHYLVAGYSAAEISATNNPLRTLAEEVREHFTSTTRIVAFMNSADRADLLAKLPNFVDVAVPGIAPGIAEARVLDETAPTVPGDLLGIDGDSGAYVYVYDRIPAGYIAAGAVDEAPPLKRRVPEAASLQGFAMLTEESHLPFYKRTWIERFGYGVANRLSFAVLQLKASGSYDVPAM